MGYLTDYDFSNNRREVIKAIEEVSNYGTSDDGKYFSIKWYGWNKNLITVSIAFPEDLIEISAEGEENGDIWKAYFKNGKSVILYPEIVFSKFDEAMLK